VLGNTRAVCRKSYIHPAVIDSYMDGSLPQALSSPAARRRPAGLGAGLREDELALLALLRRCGVKDVKAARAA
jgi:DNA topoisomerase-1